MIKTSSRFKRFVLGKKKTWAINMQETLGLEQIERNLLNKSIKSQEAKLHEKILENNINEHRLELVREMKVYEYQQIFKKIKQQWKQS